MSAAHFDRRDGGRAARAAINRAARMKDAFLSGVAVVVSILVTVLVVHVVATVLEYIQGVFA